MRECPEKGAPLSPLITKIGHNNIIVVYVDDLNIIGTPDELHETIGYLKIEFEMKGLGKTKLCLGFQVEHLSKGTFVHQP